MITSMRWPNIDRLERRIIVLQKLILEMGCITRLSQLRELHQRLPLKVFLVRLGMTEWLTGDGLLCRSYLEMDCITRLSGLCDNYIRDC